jgi:hypothetical protein
LPESLREFADSIADRVAGKVWSAKIRAVKPDIDAG